jgi:predicted PurR-regulated permease PerM
MEGVAGLSVVLIVCVGIVLAILLILMPVFVFQISNSTERIEKAVKEILSSTVRTENSTNQILTELHKTNTHFITPAE